MVNNLKYNNKKKFININISTIKYIKTCNTTHLERK